MNRVYSNQDNMLVTHEEGEDRADKCRERRRRRMAMRKMAVRGEGNQKYAVRTTSDHPNPMSLSTAATMNLISSMEMLPSPPMYGTMSVIGRQRQMLDEICVRTNLCRPEINGFQPVHFFGVFDGQISALCKEHMQGIMNEELMRAKVVVGEESNGGDGVGGRWRLAIKRGFQRMGEMAVKLWCRGLGSGFGVRKCNPHMCLMGSAAVVSILTKDCMVTASCGDSSAVLCREGLPISLSINRKADEGACGGRIVSRPIDGKGFWAASEPEISITKREAKDECFILGSNGLWDDVSTESACKTVHECLGNSSVERRIELECETAANILVRLALGRRSTDNISVIVIDLRK